MVNTSFQMPAVVMFLKPANLLSKAAFFLRSHSASFGRLLASDKAVRRLLARSASHTHMIYIYLLALIEVLPERRINLKVMFGVDEMNSIFVRQFLKWTCCHLKFLLLHTRGPLSLIPLIIFVIVFGSTVVL